MILMFLFSGFSSVQVQSSLGLSCRIRALWTSDWLEPPKLAWQLDLPKSESLVYVTEARWQGVIVSIQATFVTALDVGIGPSGEGCSRGDLVLSEHGWITL